MTELVIENLHAESAHRILVDDASLHLHPGEFLVVLGPNGAGKTSLLRAILGLIPSRAKTVSVGGLSLTGMQPRQIARQIAYLPQARPLAWPNRVVDVVTLGRFAHGLPIGPLKGEDHTAVNDAMQRCEIDHLAQRRADQLSGGEQARVHFARALAAKTPILLADEPITALDPRHQLRLLDLIKAFVTQGGAALVVLHDLNLAARYADRLLWMQNARIIADGTPSATLNSERLEQVYGVRATIIDGQVLLPQVL